MEVAPVCESSYLFPQDAGGPPEQPFSLPLPKVTAILALNHNNPTEETGHLQTQLYLQTHAQRGRIDEDWHPLMVSGYPNFQSLR